MTISLSDSHRLWLEDEAKRLNKSVSDIIAELIEETREAEEAVRRAMKDMLLNRPDEMADSEWEQIRRSLTEGAGPGT